MNMDKLREALRPWISVDTWHTNHPCDRERFHKALHEAFSELGTGIDGFQFEEAMLELVDEYHPGWNKEHKNKGVGDFVARAEAIANYLHDTK